MTDAEYLARWVAHCVPCAVFIHLTSSGDVQYVLMPLSHEPCADCGLTH